MTRSLLRGRSSLIALVSCAVLLCALFGCKGIKTVSNANSQSEAMDGSQAGQNAVQLSDAGKKTAVSEDGRLNLLVLANKRTSLPDDWEEKLELVESKNTKGDTVRLDKVANDAFLSLKDDLKNNENIVLEVGSGYRSVSDQQKLWDDYKKEYGEDYVTEYVAKPGHSDYNTGLSFDAILLEKGIPVTKTEDLMDRGTTWKTVHAYLAKHGFILRYPNDKEYYTGYSYVPWHFRYVGKDSAAEIMDRGISLEEYLEASSDVSVSQESYSSSQQSDAGNAGGTSDYATGYGTSTGYDNTGGTGTQNGYDYTGYDNTTSYDYTGTGTGTDYGYDNGAGSGYYSDVY